MFGINMIRSVFHLGLILTEGQTMTDQLTSLQDQQKQTPESTTSLTRVISSICGTQFLASNQCSSNSIQPPHLSIEVIW